MVLSYIKKVGLGRYIILVGFATYHVYIYNRANQTGAVGWTAGI